MSKILNNIINIILSLTILTLLILIIYCSCRENMVTSVIDNNEYKVLEWMDNPYEAADELAKINKFNMELINSLLKNPKNSIQYLLGTRLKNRYKRSSLFENDPPDKYNTSYTEDKGRTLALCLREEKSKDLHDFNTLQFVSSHELAHIASINYGHDEEFWSNFYILLKEAKKCCKYDPQNYSKNPINYCSLDVDYNPYFDEAYILKNDFI